MEEHLREKRKSEVEKERKKRKLGSYFVGIVTVGKLFGLPTSTNAYDLLFLSQVRSPLNDLRGEAKEEEKRKKKRSDEEVFQEDAC